MEEPPSPFPLYVPLSEKRVSDLFPEYKNHNRLVPSYQLPVRTLARQDGDRTCFSFAVRRLDGRTQVRPTHMCDDHTTNRLFHSQCVAVVGRTIADILYFYRIVDDRDIANVVNAACLLHDVGTPPFGHGGEEALETWWHDFSDAMGYIEEGLTDLSTPEGNARGFTTLLESDVSLSVLLAYSKYPCINTQTDRHIPAQKKHGVMQHEAHILLAAQKEVCGWEQPGHGLKVIPKRHCLVLPTETADDICNGTTDPYDAYRQGLISLEELVLHYKTLLNNLCAYALTMYRHNPPAQYQKLYDETYALWVSINIELDKHVNNDNVEALSSACVHFSCYVAALSFALNHKAIMEGDYHNSLIPDSCFPAEYKKKYFRASVIQTGVVCGTHAIGKLMTFFSKAVLAYFMANDTHAIESKQSLVGRIIDARMLKDPQTLMDLYKRRKTYARGYDALPERYQTKLQALREDQVMGAREWFVRSLLVVSSYVFDMTDSYCLQRVKELGL